jgi:mycothiol synthase
MAADLVTRAPTLDDAQAVTELVIACDVDEYGAPDFELDDLLTDWRTPGFDLAEDARVVAADVRVVAYAALVRSDYADVYVHPDFRGRGLGSELREWTERRAAERAPAGGSLLLGQVVSSVNEDARALLEGVGYRPVRTYWRMVAELGDEPPPAPHWPEGVRVRSFDREHDDRAVHALVQEAFGDNERHVPQSFEEWEAFMIDREAFEPGLWFVAEADGELVGAVLCPSYEEEGWIRQLAVARDWRRRGLGTALLLRAFGEFHRRGRREVGLAVDSWNRTGALGLYERAGMRLAREYTRFEKEIPAGAIGERGPEGPAAT